jgi:thioester reductase-like protein
VSALSPKFLIVRPGMIGSSCRDGVGNRNDFDARFVLACLELGKAPDSRGPLASTPVDYLADLIVHCLIHSRTGHMNVQSPHTEDDDLSVLVCTLGLPRVPYPEWRALLGSTALAPLLDMFAARSFPTRSGRTMRCNLPLEMPRMSWSLFVRWVQQHTLG